MRPVKSDPAIPQIPAPPSEEESVASAPRSVDPAEAVSVLPETDNDVDECEALLRCAIQMVQAPVWSSDIPTSLPASDSASPATATSLTQAESVAPATATSLPEGESAAAAEGPKLPEAESETPAAAPNLSEAEPAAPPTAPNLPEREPAAPAISSQLAAEPAAPAIAPSISATEPATPTLPSSMSRIVVQIHYDPIKGRYVTRDTTSGLSILRHQDRARLRAMCDRLGWQVVESAVDCENG